MRSPQSPVEDEDLELGRASYERRQWSAAFEALSAADAKRALEGDDLERLVWSAGMTGNDDAFFAGQERLFNAFATEENHARSARAAFWIGMRLAARGDMGRAGGWLGRAERAVERAGADCAERGYLLLPQVFRTLGAGDDAAAEVMAAEAAELGETWNDADLVALARNLQGRALVRMGHIDRGLALLDEVMLTVTGGSLSPLVTGLVFCNVIATCQQVYAVDRAREWTDSLATWCDEQSQPGTFTGSCMVHRSEVMQLAGAWPEALEHAETVCQLAADDPDILANAQYQRGELLRLRGELAQAEAAYNLASDGGRDPQPGLALLRMRQGKLTAAVNAIRRALETTTAPWQRARLLPAHVEIMLAAGDGEAAAAACDELEAFAGKTGIAAMAASAAQARGAVSLNGGDARAAAGPLREALTRWQQLEAPHHVARVRLLLTQAYGALGDTDGADLELRAARALFEQLEIAPDATEPAAPTARDTGSSAHNLSPRELEVLRLVASGKTNKLIAAELHVSERTIDRHVSNIFTKTGVSSRSAATAFAYENKLV